MLLTGTEDYYTLSWVLGWPVVKCIDPVGLQKYNSIKTLAEHDERVKQQELKVKVKQLLAQEHQQQNDAAKQDSQITKLDFIREYRSIQA